MDCSDEEVLIVSGSLQALDLVNETLLKEGDKRMDVLSG